MALVTDNNPLLDQLNYEQKQQLYKELRFFCPENKSEIFDRLIEFRTRHLTVVLEDIEHPHNASAVLRSCDCFGVQDVHVIEKEHKFKANKGPASGAQKWVSYHRYGKRDNNDGNFAITELKKKGYRIVVTMPHDNDCMIQDLDITQPTALVFGTEKTGISDEMIAHADGFVKMPMYGFTESYNLSVCAALMLYSLAQRMRDSDIKWHLTDAQKLDVKLEWLSHAVNSYEPIVKRFVANLETKASDLQL